MSSEKSTLKTMLIMLLYMAFLRSTSTPRVAVEVDHQVPHLPLPNNVSCCKTCDTMMPCKFF
jgi:hypothetical protein